MQRIWLPVAIAFSLLGVAWVFRPNSASEWAAWVQAFGVLLAVGWSVRLQGLAASQGERQAAQVAAAFASNMHWAFRELSDACAKRSWADYKVHRRILEEILAQGREVTLQLLDGRSLAMVTSLRSIGVEALEVTESHDADGHWPPLQSYFEKRVPGIAAWLSATGNPSESNGPTDYAGLRTSLGNL
ncbi:hypothetical protein [Variovorax sp. dw_308]|uniref:hypothetical protein n=1 Tax=Variovorax sp. dw_308 TaxID=2721546 RepID=UPI001C4548E0|nr:hypothetical protein [Variovorax sp. dw_308]